MNHDIYHLVSVNGGKSDAVSIVKVFSEMATGRLECDLKLLNYYDEVPVSYDSYIATVEKDSVELMVHEHQALIMKHDRNTLIKSRHFHNGLGVHCYAAYVNVPKQTVILHDFSYAQIRAERRETVRVKVRETLPVIFSYEKGQIEGHLVTITGTGLAINSDTIPTTKADQPGLLSFTLAGTPLAVPGSFVRYIADKSVEYNCIFQMEPDRVSESSIGRFVYQRQVEIIQQLKDGLVVK